MIVRKKWEGTKTYYVMKEVASLLELEYPALVQWCKEYEIGRNQGRWKLSKEDIDTLWMIKVLKQDCGYHHKAIKRMINQIKEGNLNKTVEHIMLKIFSKDYVQENKKFYNMFAIELLNYYLIKTENGGNTKIDNDKA